MARAAFVLLVLALTLSGCARLFDLRCQAEGYAPGTTAYADCMTRQSDWLRRNTPRTPSDSPWDQSAAATSGMKSP